MAANDFSAIPVIIPALITAPQGLWAAVYDPKEATAEIGSLLKGGKFTQLALLRSRRDALRKVLCSGRRRRKQKYGGDGEEP